jgi:hypothetical protein
MNRHALSLGLIFIIAAALAGVGAQAADEEMRMPEVSPDEAVASSLDRPLVDGVVTEGEYATMLCDELIGMTVHWQAVDDTMFICLIEPGTGWGSASTSCPRTEPFMETL